MLCKCKHLFVGILVVLCLAWVAHPAQDENVYDVFREQVLQLDDVLEQAIYLAIAGFSSYDEGDQKVIAQELVDLLFAPPFGESGYRGANSPVATLFGFNAFEDWFVFSPYFSGPDIYVLRDALSNVGKFGALASVAARDALASVSSPGASAENAFRSVYAYLIAARGAFDAPFMTAGLSQLAELLPAREIVVPAGGSIAAALQALPNGGTIRLEEGSYRERLVITSDVTIIGPETEGDGSGAVIEGLAWDAVIAVASQGAFEVTLRNLTIRGGQTGVAASWSEISGDSKLVLDAIRIVDCDRGLVVGGTQGKMLVRLTDTEISGSVKSLVCMGSVSVEADRCSFLNGSELMGGDVSLYADSALVMRECTVRKQNGNCIVVADTASLYVVGSVIETSDHYYAVAVARTELNGEHPWDCGLFHGPGSEPLAEGAITGYGNSVLGRLCPDSLQYLTESKPTVP